MEKLLFTFLFLFLISCDPEILIPIGPIKVVDTEKIQSLYFKKIVIRPISFNFNDSQLKSRLNKIAVKNIQNYTDLHIMFDSFKREMVGVDSFSLDIRVFKSEKYDLEFRIFENNHNKLIYKKTLTNLRKNDLISESEKRMRKIFKIYLRKYRPNVGSLKPTSEGEEYAFTR